MRACVCVCVFGCRGPWPWQSVNKPEIVRPFFLEGAHMKKKTGNGFFIFSLEQVFILELSVHARPQSTTIRANTRP